MKSPNGWITHKVGGTGLGAGWGIQQPGQPNVIKKEVPFIRVQHTLVLALVCMLQDAFNKMVIY